MTSRSKSPSLEGRDGTVMDRFAVAQVTWMGPNGPLSRRNDLSGIDIADKQNHCGMSVVPDYVAIQQLRQRLIGKRFLTRPPLALGY